MERARVRVLCGYVERHHVVPRCLGGGNQRENIVRLTPEEHYLAHQLLVRLHPGDLRLSWAAVAMTNGTRTQARSNKLYGWLRREHARRLSARFTGHVMSDESRAKMRASHTGKSNGPHAEETKRKMSIAAKGRKKSAAHIAAMVRAKTGVRRGPHSPEHRRALSLAIRAALAQKAPRQFTEEYRAHQALTMRAIWARRRAEHVAGSSDTTTAGG